MRRVTIIGAAALTSVLATGTTIAVADIVGPDNTISSCVANKGGAVRIVGPDFQCSKTETKLVWNQQGVPGTPGTDGLDGAPGTKGEKGDPGTPGTNGVSGLTSIVGPDRTVDAGKLGTADALCPVGKVAISGGWELTGASGNASLQDLHFVGDVPIDDNNAWRVTAINVDVDNDGTGTVNFRAYVICADVN